MRVPVISFVLTIQLLGIFFAPSAWSFEAFPEFESLTETEQGSFDQPSLLGPEYQSFVLAYAKPFDWEYKWLASDIALDTSIGSVSAVHFLVDTRAKLRGKLLKWLDFRFTYFDQREHDRQSTHAIVELVSWLPFWGSRFGISAYGEPSYHKRENDVGLAILWRPAENHEIRLFNTWVDVTRQKRSDRSDKFVEPELPYARGLVGRWLSSADYIEYAIRYETKTRWRFDEESYDYLYWKELASFKISRALAPALRLNTSAQLDRRFESREALSASSSSQDAAWIRDRAMVNAELELRDLGPRQSWVLTPGFEFAHRRWSTRRDTLVYHDYLPHVQLSVPAWGTPPYEDRWIFGYDLTWHRKAGGAIIGHPSETDGAVNQRFDLSYAFVFSDKAELRLLASFDIDAIGTADTWEGGDGRFRWSF